MKICPICSSEVDDSFEAMRDDKTVSWHVLDWPGRTERTIFIHKSCCLKLDEDKIKTLHIAA